MEGREGRRYCEQCQHHITNISLLTTEERQQLINEAKGERLCVAYYVGLDGKPITAEQLGPLAKVLKTASKVGLATLPALLAACSSTQPVEQQPEAVNCGIPLDEKYTLYIIDKPTAPADAESEEVVQGDGSEQDDNRQYLIGYSEPADKETLARCSPIVGKIAIPQNEANPNTQIKPSGFNDDKPSYSDQQ